MQEELQNLPPGFPRGVIPQAPFPQLAPTMGQMHTLMPTQSLQPTQQLEYKVRVRYAFLCRRLCDLLLFNFTCLSAAAAGAVAAAAAHAAAPERHGPPGSKSFRRRGQHSAPRSAPEETSRALAARRQPGEGLDRLPLFMSRPCAERTMTSKLFASQHPIPAVAPVDEEGSDGEPDQEAVQR